MPDIQMMDNLLEIKNLTTRFYTEEGVVQAVNGISYSMKEGETLGVVGESGCGKSVHALSILQLIPIPPGKIEKGEVWFKGRDLLKLNESDMRLLRGCDIAMVFQDPMTSLNPVFTIGEQITEALELHKGMDSAASQERAAELLDMVGIPDAKRRLGDYPHQFSGGMRQRAMLAMALSCDPRLLIADEPTTDIFKRPLHPYTIGLLGSLPRLDEAPGTKLISIPGQPPDLIDLFPRCPFADRCEYKVDQCMEQIPNLIPADGTDHLVACFQWEQVEGRKFS
jgi:oligopeptide/dipeptide ABC transporter ATP-binding protein